MLALMVTAMVAVAMGSMLSAVSQGVVTRGDTRSVMIRANAAQTRLSAYIMRARCVLAVDGADVVLWLDDRRESGTVHASEIRWLIFDNATGEIQVYYVRFPDSWSDAVAAVEDLEYNEDSDWSEVLNDYILDGLASSFTLVDGIESASVSVDNADVLDARKVTYDIGFETNQNPVEQSISSTIYYHARPES